jgi:hypothetical protein
MACEELSRDELNFKDRNHPVTIAVRVVKR